MKETTAENCDKEKNNMEGGTMFLIVEVDQEDRVTLTQNDPKVPAATIQGCV